MNVKIKHLRQDQTYTFVSIMDAARIKCPCCPKTQLLTIVGEIFQTLIHFLSLQQTLCQCRGRHVRRHEMLPQRRRPSTFSTSSRLGRLTSVVATANTEL